MDNSEKRLDLILMHAVSFQFKNMVYPQILACTPKMGTRRVHVPSAENWSGHAVGKEVCSVGWGVGMQVGRNLGR